MVRIRQHGEEGQLHDFNTFLAEFDLPSLADEWEISIDWCLGEGAPAIEAFGTPVPARLSVDRLRLLYAEIYQTIDGLFVGFKAGKQLCRLEAVDSSYWEIDGPPALEAGMLLRYGAYSSGMNP